MFLEIKYDVSNKWYLTEEYKTKVLVKGFESAAVALEECEKIYPDDWIDAIIEGSSGHLMSIKDWIACCADGGFIDYDGYGDLLKGDKMLNIHIYPSRRSGVPAEATHILWYNR